MKVTGPGMNQPPDVGGAEGATGEQAFADQLAGTQGAHGALPTTATGPAATIEVADIAAELRSGKLTREAAVDKVVERVLDRQLGASAPPAVRERVGAALRDALDTDPLLAEKLQRL